MKTRMLGALALGALVAACGTDPQERVTGGAAAGAATGAAVGALAGPPGALAGAAIGGGAGAVTGAVTEPRDVNLGRPVWNDPEVGVPGRDTASRASARSGGGGMASNDTRALQRALNARGYDAGPADGVYGPRTRQAVMDWQRANNMQASGQPNAQMRAGLGLGGGSATGQTEGNRAATGGGAGGTGQRDAAGHLMGGTQGSGAQEPGESNRTGGAAASQPNFGGGPGAERPNPPMGGRPSPSNNPAGDPVGGGSQGNRPGFNQNQ